MVQTPVREQQVVRGRLPAARRDRRPALAALAVLLILLGALGSALVAFRSGDRVSVLVAAQDIKVGQQVEASDFASVKVAGNEANLVSAGSVRDYVGSTAMVGVPEGTPINAQGMFTKSDIIPNGAEEVGVVVTTKQRPGAVPQVGDVVRLYFVTNDTEQSGAAKGDFAPGDPVVDGARVTDVSSGGGVDARSITLLVKESEAGVVAALGASSNLAITILPRDTQPEVDYDTSGQ
ncbi:MAG: putative rane protein [Nocardioidaceae bacterium]|nr:putative rane protein [Nocardioidaceae bacterium]